MKKKILKGFTLLELIIVMAVFSLIMLGAMSLVDPVSRIYKHSNDFEKTYSYVDNIQNYIQGSLQYADNVWVYQGNDTTFTPANLQQEAFDFKEAFYKDIVNTKNGTTVDYTTGKIHIMMLLNSDYVDPVSGTSYKKGQILDRTIDFDSHCSIGTFGGITSYTPQLNNDFFEGKFSFDYVLGASSLVKTGSSVMVNSLAPLNVEGMAASLNPNNFAFTIVTYDTSPNKDGTDKVNLVSANKPISGDAYNYRTYDASSRFSVSNIPLMNILSRNGIHGNLNTSYYVYGKTYDSVSGTYVEDLTKCESYPGTNYDPSYSHPSASHESFEHNPDNISMSCNDNIYIIYSLCDEVNVPK